MGDEHGAHRLWAVAEGRQRFEQRSAVAGVAGVDQCDVVAIGEDDPVGVAAVHDVHSGSHLHDGFFQHGLPVREENPTAPASGSPRRAYRAYGRSERRRCVSVLSQRRGAQNDEVASIGCGR